MKKERNTLVSKNIKKPPNNLTVHIAIVKVSLRNVRRCSLVNNQANT